MGLYVLKRWPPGGGAREECLVAQEETEQFITQSLHSLGSPFPSKIVFVEFIVTNWGVLHCICWNIGDGFGQLTVVY